jgi:hypothetical protein
MVYRATWTLYPHTSNANIITKLISTVILNVAKLGPITGKGHRLRASGNGLLRWIFGPHRKEVTRKEEITLWGQFIICTFNLNIFSGRYSQSAPVWWPGLKNSPTVTHACRKRRLKWVPGTWGYSWVTLSLGVINTEAWSSRLGVGRWTNNPAL